MYNLSRIFQRREKRPLTHCLSAHRQVGPWFLDLRVHQVSLSSPTQWENVIIPECYLRCLPYINLMKRMVNNRIQPRFEVIAEQDQSSKNKQASTRFSCTGTQHGTRDFCGLLSQVHCSSLTCFGSWKQRSGSKLPVTLNYSDIKLFPKCQSPKWKRKTLPQYLGWI